MRQAGSTVRTHHNRIGLDALRPLDYSSGCFTFFSSFFPIDILQRQVVEEGFPIGLNVFRRWR